MKNSQFVLLFLTLLPIHSLASDSVVAEEYKFSPISKPPSLITRDIENHHPTCELTIQAHPDDEVGSPRTRKIVNKAICFNSALHTLLPITAFIAPINDDCRLFSMTIHNLLFFITAYNLISVPSNIQEYNIHVNSFRFPQEKFCITKLYNSCAFLLLCSSAFLSNKQLLSYSHKEDTLIFVIDLITLTFILVNSLHITSQKLCPSTFEVGYPMM